MNMLLSLVVITLVLSGMFFMFRDHILFTKPDTKSEIDDDINWRSHPGEW